MHCIYNSSMFVWGQIEENSFLMGFVRVRREFWHYPNLPMKGRLVDRKENNKKIFLMESHLIRFHALFVLWLFILKKIFWQWEKKNFFFLWWKKEKKVVYRKISVGGDFCNVQDNNGEMLTSMSLDEHKFCASYRCHIRLILLIS